jgi:outer membrane protein assembly factor BamB
MRKILGTTLSSFVLVSLAWAAEPPGDGEGYWPQWRGPLGTGVAPHGNPPIEWSEDKNIRWKIEIPGKGYGSPVVWGERLFLATAIPAGPAADEHEAPAAGRRRGNIQPTQVQKFTVLAINRQDGKLLWQTTVREELPHQGTHPDGSWSSASAVTDGEYVYAYFGSRGLYCLDLEGNVLWSRDLGDMSTRRGFGEASSPALHDDKIIVNWDHEGQSFITAIDKKTGKEVWKVNRDEITSWSTPLVVEHDGKAQVITNATKRVRSYDLETGAVLWETGGMTLNTIPTPVAANGLVYVTSGFRGSSLLAIGLAGAKGDITGSKAIVWTYDKDTPYVPSPLLYDDTLYFLKVNSGILSCFNAQTGEAYYGRQRLDGVANVYASPVGASNRVYITGRDGTTLVIKRGPQFEILASNSLDDRVDASLAIVGNDIYLRGHKYLYRISED